MNLKCNYVINYIAFSAHIPSIMLFLRTTGGRGQRYRVNPLSHELFARNL